MAFGRKWLAEVLQGEKTSAEKVDEIMNEHIAVTNALKEDRDSYKEAADKLPEVQKELEKLQGEAEKFAEERKSFEDYKNKVEQEAESNQIKAAYREMLKSEQYSDKWADRILESTDFRKMKLENGKLADEKELRKAVNEKWSDVKSIVTERGAQVDKPPQTGKARMTKEEIFAIKDTTQRQKAIAENHELFGF